MESTRDSSTALGGTARTRALLAAMTLAEKIGQLQLFFWIGDGGTAAAAIPGGAAATRSALETGTLGGLLFVKDVEEANRLQRCHLDRSRLQIPLLFGFDVIHGFRTIFPVPIGFAASWDPELFAACQAVAAREASSVGIRCTFAPMVDIARDPRWGRLVESAGEDPCLGSAMAAAQVRGFQSFNPDVQQRLLACVKHFAGYGAARGGRDYDEADLSEYELRNVYLPPFEAAVREGVASVMTAYMPLNGLPPSADRFLLSDVLRGEFGFSGFVVSDADAVANLVTHRFSMDAASAAASALDAGTDVEMSTGAPAFAKLSDAIEAGEIEEAAVDRAVLRLLNAKEAIGLLDSPFVDEQAAKNVLTDPLHRILARKAAVRSAVLLRNEGALLPLTLEAGQRVCVLGPLADSRRDTLGPWALAHDLDETITVAAGVGRGVSEGVGFDYAPGVAMPFRRHPWPFGPVHERDDTEDWAAFDKSAELHRAVELAKNAAVAIVVLGERYDMSGEIASRSTLTIPGDQQELLRTVVATGTPVVLLVMSGRPLDLAWADDHVGAILQIWYPGTAGGAAVADLLFGRASPGGKLPFNWPRSAGQAPLPYSHAASHDPENQDIRYWDEDGKPLYPFGFGLSYSSFRYTDLVVSRPSVHADEPLTASVLVTNTGDVAADTVAQLYLGQRYGSSARPTRELKCFVRTVLAPGEERRFEFTIEPAHRRHWSTSKRAWVEDKAVFDVWIGQDSTASLHGSFVVLGDHEEKAVSAMPLRRSEH